MSNLAVAAAAGLSAVVLMGAGNAAGTGTLSDFLADCRINAQHCKEMVSDIIINGREAHYICLPSDLETADAAQKEIDWLENVVPGDQKLANEDATDGLWSGASKLWPCHKA